MILGSGDCTLTASNQGGGFNDEYHKWLIECADGEAMIGNTILKIYI
jgi:hypothetical protein